MICVTSSIDPYDRYRVHLELTPDDIVPMPAPRARAWADAILRTVSIAEYESAIVKSMLETGTTILVIAQFVADLRIERNRGELPAQVVPGLDLEAGVRVIDSTGFVTLILHGYAFATLELPEARKHALHMLESVTAAELNTNYLRTLKVAGLPDQSARAAVSALQDYR
jgi:hypothetical protein